MSITPDSYTGLDTLPQQIIQKLNKRGFTFNLMVVGKSGLGKSTLVNSIFASHLKNSVGKSYELNKTMEIQVKSHLIVENNVQVKVSIVDTPGFGDLINNDKAWEPIVKYIRDQYSLYLRRELTPARERTITDTRVHAVIYFVFPSGHGLSSLDVLAMKAISECANLIPVIAKSDTLTLDERFAFKVRVKEELKAHGIQIYPNIYGLDLEGFNDAEKRANDKVSSLMPFAVVGSERNVVIDGKATPGRRTKWGTININDPNHCEFVAFRDFLLKNHLQELIEATAIVHYETFRTKQLLALKESTGTPKPQNAPSATGKPASPSGQMKQPVKGK